jgi:hypothetical protein
MIAIVMSEVRSLFFVVDQLLMAKAGAKNFFCPGGHDNPLKRLIPDKEIKRESKLFPWKDLATARPGFAGL